LTLLSHKFLLPERRCASFLHERGLLPADTEKKMGKLDEQIAIVTGASSGIGEAIAQLYASEGASVLIVHHDDPHEAFRIVREICADGGKAIAAQADVRNEAGVDHALATARNAFGDPTLLVNSAGVDASGIEVSDMPTEQFMNVLRTNLVGPFLFCRAFVQGLKATGKKGKIINISSVHEDIPRAGAADYCASKGGLRNLTRCLALELAPLGITANGIAPGMVLTPMNQDAIDDPEKLKEQVASIPLKRAAQPEEVAELALYLASKAADYASGATFTLDGGLAMNLGQGA
jgi:glucose 1-dehydrogenase